MNHATRWTLGALLAAGMATGCAAPSDTPTAATQAALERGEVPTALPVPEGTGGARLFDPKARGASPYDATIAALIDAWRAAPRDEASAQAHVRTLQGAREELARAGAPAADRIAQVCGGVPVEDRDDTLLCMRLLSLADSPRSLDLLAQRARTPIPPWPEDAHPTDPPPQALAQRVAMRSLAARGRAGSEEAVEHLLRIVAAPEGADRDLAIAAVYRVLPRVHAKARLRAALPADEHYRLYESR